MDEIDGYYWRLRVNPGRKYNPDQPRVPAGDPRGGQWTSTGGSVRVGQPRQGFDYTRWWGDQEELTLFHGTSAENYEKIRESGLRPSETGYTEGETFFSTSPRQAWLYSAMGGEVAAGGYATLPDEERVVLVVKVPSTSVRAAGVFRDPESYAKISQWVRENPGEDTDWIMGEFTTADAVPPDWIVDAFRYPSGIKSVEIRRWQKWTKNS